MYEKERRSNMFTGIPTVWVFFLLLVFFGFPSSFRKVMGSGDQQQQQQQQQQHQEQVGVVGDLDHQSLSIEINEKDLGIDTNPDDEAELLCKGAIDSCKAYVKFAIERLLVKKYGASATFLVNKKLDVINPICNILMPVREKPKIVEYLHIPKAGTSLNWILQNYWEDCLQSPPDSGDPCPRWFDSLEDQMIGLCKGKLYTCNGHNVISAMTKFVEAGIDSPVAMVTMLRNPWDRLQSAFHYHHNNPDSGYLSWNDIDKEKLLSSSSVMEYALFPGIPNCMTKVRPRVIHSLYIYSVYHVWQIGGGGVHFH